MALRVCGQSDERKVSHNQDFHLTVLTFHSFLTPPGCRPFLLPSQAAADGPGASNTGLNRQEEAATASESASGHHPGPASSPHGPRFPLYSTASALEEGLLIAETSDDDGDLYGDNISSGGGCNGYLQEGGLEPLSLFRTLDAAAVSSVGGEQGEKTGNREGTQHGGFQSSWPSEAVCTRDEGMADLDPDTEPVKSSSTIIGGVAHPRGGLLPGVASGGITTTAALAWAAEMSVEAEGGHEGPPSDWCKDSEEEAAEVAPSDVHMRTSLRCRVYANLLSNPNYLAVPLLAEGESEMT